MGVHGGQVILILFTVVSDGYRLIGQPSDPPVQLVNFFDSIL